MPVLHDWVKTLSITLKNELETIPTYSVTKKGNLSIHGLVDGASKGYPQAVVALLDNFCIKEIDSAGRCLILEQFTACGFHILRSMEIAIKGYVHAATGSLPPINRRVWGEYISQLTGAGASSDLIDILKILKTKRNPLMHPQDSLEEDEAIDIFCLCQTAMGALVKDIKDRSLDVNFSASLALLPTI